MISIPRETSPKETQLLEGVDVPRGTIGMISIPRETSPKETQLLEGVGISRGTQTIQGMILLPREAYDPL